MNEPLVFLKGLGKFLRPSAVYAGVGAGVGLSAAIISGKHHKFRDTEIGAAAGLAGSAGYGIWRGGLSRGTLGGVAASAYKKGGFRGAATSLYEEFKAMGRIV